METNKQIKQEETLKGLFSVMPVAEPSPGFTDRVMQQIGLETTEEKQALFESNSKTIWYILISISGLGAIISLYTLFPLNEWFKAITGGYELEFGLIVYLHQFATGITDKLKDFDSGLMFLLTGLALATFYAADKLLKNKTPNTLNSFLAL